MLHFRDWRTYLTTATRYIVVWTRKLEHPVWGKNKYLGKRIITSRKYDSIDMYDEFFKLLFVNKNTIIDSVFYLYLLSSDYSMFEIFSITWKELVISDTFQQNHFSHENIVILNLKISFKPFLLAKLLKSIVFESCHDSV